MHPVQHFQTVSRHRREVLHNCILAGIPLQGLVHDLSKYAPVEFFNGARYYTGTHSPNVEERKLYGYSRAWLHHKGRNKHHFEYWWDYDMAKRRPVPVKMPLRYVKEMFCDRVAASRVYRGEAFVQSDPLTYYRGGVASKHMHPDTASLLEKWLVILADQGEEVAFRAVRQTKKKDY
jgi:hypothetical protein